MGGEVDGRGREGRLMGGEVDGRGREGRLMGGEVDGRGREGRLMGGEDDGRGRECYSISSFHCLVLYCHIHLLLSPPYIGIGGASPETVEEWQLPR